MIDSIVSIGYYYYGVSVGDDFLNLVFKYFFNDKSEKELFINRLDFNIKWYKLCNI